MRLKTKYLCIDGGDLRRRSNTITLDFHTDKYETILDAVKKESTWGGEIVLYSIEESAEGVESTDNDCTTWVVGDTVRGIENNARNYVTLGQESVIRSFGHTERDGRRLLYLDQGGPALSSRFERIT